MTEEEFREKWGHLTDEQVEKVVPVLIEEIIDAVQAIEFLDVVEAAEENGLTSEEAEFVYDMAKDPRLAEMLREALS